MTMTEEGIAMTMTQATRVSPTCVRIQRAEVDYGEDSLDLYLSDANLDVAKLWNQTGIAMDTESIPVLVGVDWRTGHTEGIQVHLPQRVSADPQTGAEIPGFDYDQVAVIDAAIVGLQRARAVVLRANGRGLL